MEVNPYLLSEDEWRQPAAGSFATELKTGPLVEVPFEKSAAA